MSVFGNIMSAIFKHGPTAAAAVPASSAAPSAAPGSAPAAGAAAAGAAAAKPMTRAEVEAMIAKIAAAQHEQYNWKQSIVDLMKLLNLDSSLNARKQLAQELGYTGALNGSAEMNIWLHQQVMTKLAESGGKVPDSLRV
jgi:3-oxoacyl-ACP reductase-like protein